ncbi:ABC transporter ATP-binding protein [Ventosimonas gracilis]|uniref:ABC transporter ATP-binding protein n=1 Tax=Ventosimonas gracilis TaxID=1680762 RepID=A0A139SVZ9_9GAMM|nr:ABC transporter ATP-binding protein [Ventosimonas gracilis]KXU38775.1 ABC transporter ATP-binding protein [Ventosimonas gracilis]
MLEVQGLQVSYGAVKAVRGIHFHLKAGELLCLLGANGAGKSSTLKAIAGVQKASNGSLWLDGQDLSGARPEQIARAGIAVVPETRDVFPDMSVLENLQLGAWLHRRDTAGNKVRLEELYARFPPLAQRRHQAAGTLSGGEQQMLSIARALMSRPRLLLLDEPSLGLAPAISQQIFALIAQLKSQGLGILLIEQNVQQALQIADRALVMRLGQIVLQGTAAEVAQQNLSAQYLGEQPCNL